MATIATADDIIKLGILRKGRKAKKRFFVIRQDSYNAPARLDCYESDKRFRQGVQPKLSIRLKDVFNINKTVIDNKFKYCIGVFGHDETLTLVCENMQEQEVWLYTLLNVCSSAKSGTPAENARPNFEYVWDVEVTNKGLAIERKVAQLSGFYRFCLTSCSIYLYKKSSDEDCIEFPLVYISNYGHKGDMLFLRVGRSAVTGHGELWLHTEDPSVAQNIHETMKNILEENHEQRKRTTSLTDSKSNLRGSLWHSQRSCDSIGGGSEKLPHSSGSFSSDKFQCYSHPQAQRHATRLSNYSSSRRSSTGTAEVLSVASTDGLNDSNIIYGSSKPACRPCNERTLSFEYFPSSGIERSTIVEEDDGGKASTAAVVCDDYLPMHSSATSHHPVSMSRSVVDRNNLLRTYSAGEDRMKWATTNNKTASFDSDYTTAELLERGNSSDKCSSVDDYTPMKPSTTDSSVSSSKDAESVIASPRRTSWHLDEVKSFISGDDNEDYNSRRSSSVILANVHTTPPLSTRSSQVPSSLLRRLTHAWGGGVTSSQDSDRQRANSVGSWNNRFLRKHSTHCQPGIDVSTSSDKDLRQRSESFGSSGPSLPSDSMSKHSARSKQSNRSEDLVEMDFGPSQHVDRSYSGSLSSSESLFHSRTNSCNSATVNCPPTNTWSPRIEQIVEHDSYLPSATLVSPSAKLIKMLFENRLKEAQIGARSPSEYVAMVFDTNPEDYSSPVPSEYVFMSNMKNCGKKDRCSSTIDVKD